jgi:hypothetical protein
MMLYRPMVCYFVSKGVQTMAKYFHISSGMRGCYMPDTSYIAKCETRRELKAALEYEYASQVDDGECFGNRKDIARIAAEAWREAKKARPTIYDFVIPYGNELGGGRPYGIFCAVSTRDDYLAAQNE